MRCAYPTYIVHCRPDKTPVAITKHISLFHCLITLRSLSLANQVHTSSLFRYNDQTTILKESS